MTRESEIVTYLLTDATLVALLPGGIYTGQEVDSYGGFSREDGSPTEDAYDADGFLLACAMVRDGAIVPSGGIRDLKEKTTGVSQTSRIYYYQDRGHGTIFTAADRGHYLMEGHQFFAAYPAEWAGDTQPLNEGGPLKGNSVIQQSWLIRWIRGN